LSFINTRKHHEKYSAFTVRPDRRAQRATGHGRRRSGVVQEQAVCGLPLDRQQTGLKDVAAKNAGVAGAADTLANHIKNGTQGNWGAMPMPANPVTDEEAKTLANWVLSLK
jgi:cytochrome c551/c552